MLTWLITISLVCLITIHFSPKFDADLNQMESVKTMFNILTIPQPKWTILQIIWTKKKKKMHITLIFTISMVRIEITIFFLMINVVELRTKAWNLIYYLIVNTFLFFFHVYVVRCKPNILFGSNLTQAFYWMRDPCLYFTSIFIKFTNIKL